MAPVAAFSRPPGRPKLRTKLDELPAVYTARNLDRCTRQLGHWNPFASSGAASAEHSRGDSLPDDPTGRNVGLREGNQQAERNPNFGAGSPGDEKNAHPMLSSVFQSAAVSSEYRQFPGSLRQQGSNRGVFEFGKMSAIECGDSREGHGRRVYGWSKRRKQLSHALVRGLWRWKDGFHARKRMKRCGPEGGRNSGSDKSSDRAPYGVHASDPSTAPTSKAGPFKWSDFPVTPTDSSGELFNCAGDGNTTLMAEMNALGKDWTARGCSCSGDNTTSASRPNCDQCWLGDENPNLESGYGSEPGYRGDEELEFGDGDEEQDEEEIEPKHLRVWTKAMARSTHAIVQVQNHDMTEINPQAKKPPKCSLARALKTTSS